MEQLQYSSKLQFYGNKGLLKGKIKTLKGTLYTMIKDHQFNLELIEFNLINDQQLLKINKTSLQHDYYTDIITFDYSENNNIIGDIYISLDRIKENASIYKTSSSDELLRVVIHGVLHLCGYKDKRKSDKEKMTKMENRYLGHFYKMFHGEHQ